MKISYLFALFHWNLLIALHGNGPEMEVIIIIMKGENLISNGNINMIKINSSINHKLRYGKPNQYHFIRNF